MRKLGRALPYPWTLQLIGKHCTRRSYGMQQCAEGRESWSHCPDQAAITRVDKRCWHLDIEWCQTSPSARLLRRELTPDPSQPYRLLKFPSRGSDQLRQHCICLGRKFQRIQIVDGFHQFRQDLQGEMRCRERVGVWRDERRQRWRNAVCRRRGATGREAEKLGDQGDVRFHYV